MALIGAANTITIANEGAVGNAEVVMNTPGLVAFWTFGEDAGQVRVSVGTKEKHPLAEVAGPIARIEGGPFSGYAAELNGKQWFSIEHAETGALPEALPDHMPKDPFSGRDFEYEVTADGFLLRRHVVDPAQDKLWEYEFRVHD